MKLRESFILGIVILLGGCATITMPTGGPRDETPPTLLNSTPSNNQKNFSGTTLEFTFSEDIQLKDAKEEILIIPTLGKQTKFIAKKRTVVITPEYKLQENTTYNINFRDGVTDLTESNPAENLRVAFSTGQDIDSLSIAGNIKDTFTEKIPEKITIALYQADTFDIYKHTPIYFTKSNKEGEFLIPNLKSGNYFIYTFDDKNKNLKVDSKTERFGYKSQPIILTESIDSLEVSLIHVDARSLALTTIRHTSKNSRVRFNKQLDSLTVKGITRKESLYYFGGDQSELIFEHQFTGSDSIPVNILAKDSVGQKIDTTVYIRLGEIKAISESLKSKETRFKYYPLSKTVEHIIAFNKPIKLLRLDSAFIQYDSANIQVLKPTDFTIDSLTNTVKINLPIKDPVKDEKVKPIKIYYGIGTFISIDQDTSKAITKTLTIPKEDELATMLITVETNQPDYIVQLIDEKAEIVQSIRNKKDIIFKLLEPKEYRINVLIDRNKNGKWDTGNFYFKEEPEKIVLFKSEENKYTVPLRANWEVGPLLLKF